MLLPPHLKKIPATVGVKPLAGPPHLAVTAPASKSLANRAILLAGIAMGTSSVHGIPPGDDTRSALAALESLGVKFEKTGPDTLTIHGLAHDFAGRCGLIHIGSAGTVGRFLPGLLAGADRGGWIITASEQLAARPLAPLVEALQRWGAAVHFLEPDAAFPLMVRGAGLQGGLTEISARDSSQFASGLLLAAPYCRRDAVVRITALDPDERYLDATLAVMQSFGIGGIRTVTCSDTSLEATIPAGQFYHAADYTVEADLNAALVFLFLPLLAGGRVGVANVSPDSKQPGSQLFKIIENMGGVLSSGVDATGSDVAGGMGLTVSRDLAATPRLKGGFTLDMRAMSESAVLMAVAAAFADAPVTLTNLAHIRNHETDRLQALHELLYATGIANDVGPDWLRVHPTPKIDIRNVTVDSRGDHRLVMACTLLGLAGNGMTITGAEAVAKTFPGFFDVLGKGLGFGVFEAL